MPASDGPQYVKVVAPAYETKTKKLNNNPNLKFRLKPSDSSRGVTYGVVTGGGGRDKGSFKISVQVNNAGNGRPIPNAVVQWYHRLNTIDKQTTSSGGEANLTSHGDISDYLHQNNGLEVHASGYSLGRLDHIKFDEGGRTINISFNLTPK